MNDQVTQEAAHFRAVQTSKFNFTYSLNIPVANNTTLPAILTIEEDANFLIERITGNASGPTDVNGLRQTAVATVFPMAGTTTGYADRGLMIQITDTGVGRPLTNGFVPVELLLSPGYGVSLHQPYPFRYYALKNSKLRFDIRNRDTTAGGHYHYLSLAVNGFKYMV